MTVDRPPPLLPSRGSDSSTGRHSHPALRRVGHCRPLRDACPLAGPESFRLNLVAACAAVGPEPACAIAPARSSECRWSRAVSRIRFGPPPPSQRSLIGPHRDRAAGRSRRQDGYAKTVDVLLPFLQPSATVLPKTLCGLPPSSRGWNTLWRSLGQARWPPSLCIPRHCRPRPASFPDSARHLVVAPFLHPPRKATRRETRPFD